MDDTKVMLQAIINGQRAIKEELLNRINDLDNKFSSKIEKLDQKIEHVDEKLTTRLDKIGAQLAYLEDDTPTREEFNNLEKKITKINQKLNMV